MPRAPRDASEARRLHEDGMSIPDIARQLRVSRSKVTAWIHPPPPKVPVDEYLEPTLDEP